MKPTDVKEDQNPSQTLASLLKELHRTGPDTQQKLEELSLYKEISPHHFEQFEEQILASMGLFYKLPHPSNLYSFLMTRMGRVNTTKDGTILTPVQASMRRAIDDNQFVSISAPTSAGKSYSIRDFILSGTGDAVIVVPSRALIAEYIGALQRYFDGDKGIMVLPFVEKIFTSRVLRRIFVLTPERARDIFDKTANDDVKVFFFDEAQVSEEGRRGIVFDVLVRRISRTFHSAKLIFAHPFVENPGAQFLKHGLRLDVSFSKSYTQGAVGKVFVFGHGNGKDYYFSPFEKNGHHLKSCVEFPNGFSSFALDGTKTILSYVSKASIYSGKFSLDFDSFIATLPNIEAPDATDIIHKIGEMLGVDKETHRSKMLSLMERGVVIHHGSVPLEVRFLIEEFIRGGHAKVCFATSTLAQGVNMPFDIVWLNSMNIQGDGEEKRALAFKNLIGRAGRLSSSDKFDYGYVYTRNPTLLIERLNHKFTLSEDSILDTSEEGQSPDNKEVIDAIKEGTFDDELHMPQSRLDRLKGQPIQLMEELLQILYADSAGPRNLLRGRENSLSRQRLSELFRGIYEAYLGRALLDGEQSVFREAIFVMLLTFAGRSFREIAGLRFSRISQRDKKEAQTVAFSQPATELPDSKLVNSYPLFPPATKKQHVSYDVVVFDTYDYLDKVISFCLNDVFAASAKVYHKIKKDDRALKFVELLRFGTNDAMHVLMMRYGFLPDQIEKIIPYVQRISESDITFKRSLDGAPDEVRNLVEWYR